MLIPINIITNVSECVQRHSLYQHSIQVVNKNKSFCVPRTFSFCRGIERGIENRFFILVLYRSLKFWYRDNPTSDSSDNSLLNLKMHIGSFLSLRERGDMSPCPSEREGGYEPKSLRERGGIWAHVPPRERGDMSPCPSEREGGYEPISFRERGGMSPW